MTPYLDEASAVSDGNSLGGSLGGGIRPLKIVIVGAGIAGLAAAIGLRRVGHEVHLFEQSRSSCEVGAAVHLPPNANGILRAWGILGEEMGAARMDRLCEFRHTGEVIRDLSLSEANKRWAHPWQLVHRAALHEKLKRVATDEAGTGIPAKLHLGSRGVDFDPHQGVVILESGEPVVADVIVGADGVFSRTRLHITTQNETPFASGQAAFRFLMPRGVAEQDSDIRALIGEHNSLYLWYGTDRRIVCYPCNDNQMLNFVLIHPDPSNTPKNGSEECYSTCVDRGTQWDNRVSADRVLEVFQDFDPVVKKLISMARPEEMKVWRLYDMVALPTLCSGRLVLIGDAAHPFMPQQGQGAAQAIEDAAALATVMGLGVSPAEVSQRLKLYETIRYERAHKIQEFSRQAGRDLVDGRLQVDMMQFTNYNFGHDELNHAASCLERWLNSERLTAKIMG